MKVGFDLDGVLADFDGHFRARYLSPRLGRPVEGEEVTQYQYDRCIAGCTPELFKDAFEQFVRDSAFLELSANQHLVGRAKGNGSYFITRRPLIMLAPTVEWLRMQGLQPDNRLFIVRNGMSKSAYAQMLGLDEFWEDSLQDASDVAGVVDRVYLVDMPYNRGELAYRNIIRVDKTGNPLNER